MKNLDKSIEISNQLFPKNRNSILMKNDEFINNKDLHSFYEEQKKIVIKKLKFKNLNYYI